MIARVSCNPLPFLHPYLPSLLHRLSGNSFSKLPKIESGEVKFQAQNIVVLKVSIGRDATRRHRI